MEFLYLILEFLKIGVLGFGGGLAILPMIFQSVEKLGVMGAEEFANLVGIAQVTPGPIAVNAATYAGFNMGGLLGGAAATLAVCLPGFILVIIVTHYLERFQKSRIVAGIFKGIRPVTVGLIFTAMMYVAEGTVYKSLELNDLIADITEVFNPVPCVIFLITVILAGKFKINPIILICVMGIAGAVTYGYII